MLINFSVENFRSFGAEQTLNLVASKAEQGHADHCVPIPGTDEQALRIAVLYGANAAGKSNLVRAMDFAKGLVIRGVNRDQPIALDSFRFSDPPLRGSSFEFRFMVQKQIFVYGFDIFDGQVTEEWLAVAGEDGGETDVFTRNGTAVTFANSVVDSVTRDSIQALVTLGVRPNQLLLNKVLDVDESRRGALLNAVAKWFTELLVVIPPDIGFATTIEVLDGDPQLRQFASGFLSNVGTGIGELSIEKSEIAMSDLYALHFKNRILANNGGEPAEIEPAGGSLMPDPDDPLRLIRKKLTANHSIGNARFSLPFAEESDGTQRLLHLLPALYVTNTVSFVFVIDEFDRSLHPVLAYAFLKYFLESAAGPQRQLIATTHETHLLDRELLRRDEIWFAEKDALQQTHLSSLSDLCVRDDLQFEKSYVQGRFGAIPIVGGLEKLKQLTESSNEVADAKKKAN